MAFKPGAFALGFLERKEEYQSERREEISDLLKISFADALDRARVNRKERKAKKEALSSIGSSLTSLGLSDAQAASILAMGPDGAKTELARLQDAAGKGFDVTTAVTAAGDANITISDAIAQLLGETQAVDQADRVIETGGGMFEPDAKFQQSVIQELAKAYGEDVDTVYAEAAGYTTGDMLKAGKIDYQALGAVRTPEEELQKKVLQKQLEKYDADIREIDAKINQFDFSDANSRGSFRKKVTGILTPLMTGAMFDKNNNQLQPELSYTEVENYKTGSETAKMDQALQARVEQVTSDIVNDLASGRFETFEEALEFYTKEDRLITVYDPETNTASARTAPATAQDEQEEQVPSVIQPGDSVTGSFSIFTAPSKAITISGGVNSRGRSLPDIQRDMTDDEYSAVINFLKNEQDISKLTRPQFEARLRDYLRSKGLAGPDISGIVTIISAETPDSALK